MTYNIGDIICDMRVDGYHKNSSKNQILECTCLICGNKKNIRASMIKDSPGSVSHSYCNYYCPRGLALSNPRLHIIWKNMKSRIYNPKNQDYYNYGGRGLTTDYDKFEDFYNDLHESYYEACQIYGESNTSMDRIDNNLGYIKGNIRWSNALTQTRNKRYLEENKFFGFSPDGNVYISNNKTCFSKNHGFSPSSICDVLYNRTPSVYGWTFRYVNDPELLLFAPYNVIEEFYY